MYTKCVLTASLSIVHTDLRLNLKKGSGIIRGTMYTKCVLTVSLNTVQRGYPFNLKKR